MKHAQLASCVEGRGGEGTQSWVIEEYDGPQLHWHLLVLLPISKTALSRV